MIIFEKLLGDKILDSWTTIFENTKELMEFMNENKENILGTTFGNKNYSIRIRETDQKTIGGNK